MTQKTVEADKTATSIPAPLLEVFNEPIASTVKNNSEAIANSMQVVPAKVGEFVAGRIKANVQLYQTCQECTDWSDLMDAQQTWLKDTNAAFADQTNTIIAMTQSLFGQIEAPKGKPETKASGKAHK
ncbi:hypothetical protein ACFOY8_16260 [Thalassospira xianhensis]|uniref:Phasin domain-containing protein n=1 Tax=Thalassospira xianhensis MCCC 1A02616 TaxID=1177929 RepID=A0A367U6A4_9PROT|nr:hypothetical protein [Thalassospira xianhensis]RCK03836.1 hypothetical protein TH5_23275 [Thalassospira xianhensis MCCC 1A02616]UKV13555.1 hypothetical protein L6172_16075 [Thalassospiraceae bacterium SW-3-3]